MNEFNLSEYELKEGYTFDDIDKTGGIVDSIDYAEPAIYPEYDDFGIPEKIESFKERAATSNKLEVIFVEAEFETRILLINLDILDPYSSDFFAKEREIDHT